MNTDHSITKGYPYDIIISKDRFKHRLDPILDHANKGRILLNIDPQVYLDFKGVNWYHRLFAGSIIDFLFFRVFDYAEALHVAEAQIEHLLQEEPFLPEDFGFVKIVGPKEIHDNPVKIYTSRYNDNTSIFRNLEQDCEWILIEKGDDNAFKQTKLQLPNHRIAYAAFVALSVQVEEKEEINNNQKINNMSKNKQFKAVYFNANADSNRSKSAEIIVSAEDKSDAMAKAKFIFETDYSLALPSICEFHHITITEEEGSESVAVEGTSENLIPVHLDGSNFNAAPVIEISTDGVSEGSMPEEDTIKID